MLRFIDEELQENEKQEQILVLGLRLLQYRLQCDRTYWQSAKFETAIYFIRSGNLSPAQQIQYCAKLLVSLCLSTVIPTHISVKVRYVPVPYFLLLQSVA